jgi:hypothetical protein
MTVKKAYHITDVENLAAIIATTGLLSDARMQGFPSTAIGYSHIKERRLKEFKVSCAVGQPFVGEFVPFYYCPRSVMLYTVNKGNTGRPEGCQRTILHLVTDTDALIAEGREWAISDGNAGAAHTSFYNSLDAFDQLDWSSIRTKYWSGKQHQKAAEFLVKDFVPWTAFAEVACYDEQVSEQVKNIIQAGGSLHRPSITVKNEWYY